MIKTLEEIMRGGANRLRLKTEKRRAQEQRSKDAAAHEQLDMTLRDLADKHIIGEKTLGDVSKLRTSAQRQAKSRGLFVEGNDGVWRYDKSKVHRDNRPAEKLVKGELDAARWNRVTAGISEAASVREYGAEYYADVARDAYRETVMAEGRTEKEYFDWRNEEIKRGIEHGFIELKPNGRIRPLEHCETVNRPAERLLTGKVNGHKKDSGISR